MNKLIIYTRFPAVVADLLASHYKQVVLPAFAALIGPIEVGTLQVEFPYPNFVRNDPLETWLYWTKMCGLVTSYKLEEPQP